MGAEILEDLDPGVERAARAHQAVRDGVLEAEGVADGDDGVARAHGVAVAEGDDGQAVRLHADERQVVLGARGEDLDDVELTVAAQVAERDLHVRSADDDVQVRGDPAVGADDEARPERLVGADGDDRRQAVRGDVGRREHAQRRRRCDDDRRGRGLRARMRRGGAAYESEQGEQPRTHPPECDTSPNTRPAGLRRGETGSSEDPEARPQIFRPSCSTLSSGYFAAEGAGARLATRSGRGGPPGERGGWGRAGPGARGAFPGARQAVAAPTGASARPSCR